MRLSTFGLVLALSQASITLSQPAPDAFDLCALEQAATARLACFDRQMATRPTLLPERPTPPAAAAAASSDVGLTARQISTLHPERAKPAEVAPASIEAKVVRVIARRPLISAFELDNGQVWEQNESLNNLRIRPQDTLSIREGMMGGFIMKAPDGQTLRVHRIR